jgi:ion channel-forming bestrophin family protein
MNDNYPFWFAAITQFHKTKVLKILFLSVVAIGAYTGFLVFLEFEILKIDFRPGPAIFSLLGIVLGLMLVFRTNTAYERWWEGRKLLGTLVNNSRNFALKLDSFLPESDKESRKFFAVMIPNYAFAMKEHLREGVNFEELENTEGALDELKKAVHVPNKIANLIIARVNALYKAGVITNEQMLILDKQTEVFTDIVGGCERIKNTPIPFSYRVHLKKFIFLYMLILPFGFIHDLHYWTIMVMVIIFYAFVGLEVIGEEIEDPFGRDANDLPTDQISATIRRNVKEIFNIKA